MRNYWSPKSIIGIAKTLFRTQGGVLLDEGRERREECVSNGAGPSRPRYSHLFPLISNLYRLKGDYHDYHHQEVRVVAALHLMAKRLASFRPPVNTHNIGIAATALFSASIFSW